MRHNAKNENIATSAAGQSSAESLGQLVAHLRKTRTQLPEGWAGRISEAKWPTGMSEEKIVSELSSSMLRVRERLLILSVVGAIDWQRARQLTERLLRGIRVNRAKVVVLDLTGVRSIDSPAAHHLMRCVEASRLLGANVMMSGLSSEIALTLATIGVDSSKVNALGDLQGALEQAERLLGCQK